MIEGYNDRLNFPSNISNLAKDFIMCCLRKNPFNRKNVYKLLQHPFITLNNGDSESEDMSSLKSPLSTVDTKGQNCQRDSSRSPIRPDKENNKITKKNDQRSYMKDNSKEINYSNYKEIVARRAKQEELKK